MEEDAVLKERKDKIVKFLKTKFNLISYFLLAVIVFIAVRIRTLNLPTLRDITTGGWTLGPDLDPFLFTRWAEYIVEHGTLIARDTMRYVPVGFNTKGELLLHPYLIAWFHKIAVLFGSTSVKQSAAIYPAVMFALTVIVFFLLVRKIFIDISGVKKANIIALISSFFLSILPILLPRTIAGIPEKESVGFLFLFLSFYVFLCAWKAKSLRNKIIVSILSGIATAMIVLSWGGSEYVYTTITLAVLVSFLIGKIDKDKFYVYLIWFFSSMVFVRPFSTRFSVGAIITTISYILTILVLISIILHLYIFKINKIKKYIEFSFLSKIPNPVLAFVIILLTSLMIISVIHPDFVIDRFSEIFSTLVQPVVDRLNFTVAENRQPYYEEWGYNFGPVILGVPIFFWMFFIGSIYLFNFMIKGFNKKDRIITTLSYFIFLTCIIFSRYSSTSRFNGTNFTSLFTYFIGFIILLSVFSVYYYKYYKLKQEKILKNIKFNLIFLFVFFFLSIVSARGAVRLIMILALSTSIIVSYFVVEICTEIRKLKGSLLKIIGGALIGLVIFLTVFSSYEFYKQSVFTAKNYGPSVYNQQWQKAMGWVRENTEEDAVFAHWWDYGYWVQSIGNRATVLDGGNAITYWDYLMGRYALTGSNDLDALEFLYAHNTTHFLIDSSDIGKYGAFSSIGSDEKYDRRSWIPTLVKDNGQTREMRNSTLWVYRGGFISDEDLIFNKDGKEIFLPEGSGIIAVVIEKDSSEKLINQPKAVYYYQNNRYDIPLRYMYYDNQFIDFGSGAEAGIFLIPLINPDNMQIDMQGALLYLSKRTVKTQLAKLYLYKENNNYFKLAHSEDDILVSQVKKQYPNIGDFVYYEGVRGPIRIWEINYPSNMNVKKEYLQTEYPSEKLQTV